MATSYTNPEGSGNRTTTTLISAVGLVSGNSYLMLDGTTGSGGLWFNLGTGCSFEFWFPSKKIIDEAKFYQGGTATHGTWQWQGSQDRSSWTTLGSPFTLGGANTQTISALAGNVTAYVFYRVVQTGGSTNGGPFIHEWEFKIDEGGTTSYLTALGSGDRTSTIATSSSGITWNTGTVHPYLVNGNLTPQIFWDNSTNAGHWILFDLAAAYVVQQARLLVQNPSNQGEWKLQGSPDNSAWTDLTGSITLGGQTRNLIGGFETNSTAYRYLRLLGVSGSRTTGPNEVEMEFMVAASAFVPPVTPPDLPEGTQVKLLIDGIDRTAWLANGYAIDIEKVLSQETMHLSILDLDSTAAAYRPSVGEAIRFTRIDDSESEEDIELLFGGVIMQVTDEPIIDDLGTVTRLRCRDWMFLADQVFLPMRTFDSATARAMFTAIVETYLGPKGVTIISAPTGGPVAPELRIEDPVTTVRQALDRLTLNVGWPWRIAEPTSGGDPGEKWSAIIEPGELPGPTTLADDGASVLTDPPLRWEQEMMTHATRVWVQTATSEDNSGPVQHEESWTADGIATVVPVHVLPSELRASTTAAAASFDTTLALDGLPPDAMIRVGGRLAIDWHTQLYTVASTVTTDAEGKVTITTSEGMERDVPEGHAVQFKPGAFVQLEVNGVVTPMTGTYVWEPNEHAIVSPSAAFAAGAVVTYRTWGYHPMYVREWDPSAQQAIGWFDYETLIDQSVTDEDGHTDLAAARSFAQEELSRRLSPAKRVTCTTRIPGHYPLLMVPLSFPDRLVSGNYLLTETRIRHSTINENSDEQPLFYELVLMEGDALGESWIQYFRGRNPSQGIKWGPVGP